MLKPSKGNVTEFKFSARSKQVNAMRTEGAAGQSVLARRLARSAQRVDASRGANQSLVMKRPRRADFRGECNLLRKMNLFARRHNEYLPESARQLAAGA